LARQRSISFEDNKAEQVLASAVACEPGAFEIKKHIAGGRGWQASEPLTLFDWQQQLVDRFLFDASLKLDTSLFPETYVGFQSAATRLEGKGQGKLSHSGKRANSSRLEFTALEFSHPGYEGQVVILPPFPVALPLPTADFTMVHWLGVILGGQQRLVLKRGCLQTIADQAEVSGEVVYPIRERA